MTDYIFNRLARVSPRISRVYLYHWDSGGPLASWDSGLIDHQGNPRPAFGVLQRFLGVAPKGGAKPGKGKGKPVKAKGKK